MESLGDPQWAGGMNPTQIVTVLAALGSAAFGGVLFGFSTLVMPGLDDSPPEAGAALYVTSFAITAMYHIPLNDAFASVAADGPHAAQAWHDYARPWELWNHVRAGCAMAGSAAMVVGLLVRSA